MRRFNLEGEHFGHLTVIKECGRKNNRIMWECACDCGNVTAVDTHSLTTGNTKSCGCRKYGNRKVHGDAGGVVRSRLYTIWGGMKNRCKNPSQSRFNRYGGRGIEVCEEWQNFSSFKEWALANGYTDSLTLDRINVDEGYSPENCRWVTDKEQANNTSRNRFLTFAGETKTIAQWADVTGIQSSTLYARLFVLGWPIEKAFNTPVRQMNKRCCCE